MYQRILRFISILVITFIAVPTVALVINSIEVSSVIKPLVVGVPSVSVAAFGGALAEYNLKGYYKWLAKIEQE